MHQSNRNTDTELSAITYTAFETVMYTLRHVSGMNLIAVNQLKRSEPGLRSDMP